MSPSKTVKRQHCGVREALQKQATDALKNLIEINQRQIEALAENNQRELLTLDRKMELIFGEKERAFGALRQHSKEHGC